MCRLQFYRNMQKKSTNPSIRTLVSFLQCRLLRVFRILPYAHPAKLPAFFDVKSKAPDVKSKAPDVKSKAPDVKSKALYITVIKRTGFARFLLLRQSRRRKQITGNTSGSFSPKAFPAREKRRLIHIFVNIRPLCVAGSALRKNSLCTAGTGVPVPAPTSSSAYESTYKHRRNPRFQQPRRQINRSFSTR